MDARSWQLDDGRTLTIREAVPDDAAALLLHVAAVSAETDYLCMGPGDFELDEAGERAYLARAAASPGQVYLLAFVDDALGGSLSFAAGTRPRVRHAGELGMSVRRACWGLGIGGRLLDVLIDWARSTGVGTKLDLRVRANNARAIALYTSRGFRVEGRLTRQVVVGGTAHDHLWMGRDVGPAGA